LTNGTDARRVLIDFMFSRANVLLENLVRDQMSNADFERPTNVVGKLAKLKVMVDETPVMSEEWDGVVAAAQLAGAHYAVVGLGNPACCNGMERDRLERAAAKSGLTVVCCEEG
jgi:hypothetical protein